MKSGSFNSSPTVETQDNDLTKKILDNPEEFRVAVGQAQMDGIQHLEVTEKLFAYLTRNSDTKYLTYGDPGLKIYKAGTKDAIEKVESMNAEAYNDYLVKKKLAEKL